MAVYNDTVSLAQSTKLPIPPWYLECTLSWPERAIRHLQQFVLVRDKLHFRCQDLPMVTYLLLPRGHGDML